MHMAKEKAEKKGMVEESPDSRIDSLRRKLEIEQDLIEKGKEADSDNNKGTDDINKQIHEKISKRATKEKNKIEEELEKVEVAGKRTFEKEATKKKTNEEQDISDVENIVNVAREKSKKLPEQTIFESTREEDFTKKVKAYQGLFTKIREEVSKIVVGQSEIVDALIRALIADGHVLVEGVPGIAKTTLIRTLAQTTGCSFGRIQFTPDLLPTDIIGLSTYQEGRGFYTLKGPIFNNFVLADEINRAPPKVQSALLECMGEKQPS